MKTQTSAPCPIRQVTDGMSFVLEDQEHGTFVVNIPAMGRHNVANALAAYCAATRLAATPRGSSGAFPTLSRPAAARRWWTARA